MTAYIIRRAFTASICIIGVTVLVFLLLRLQSASPVDAVCAGTCSEAQYAELEHELGLDKAPIPAYFSWVGGAVRGDFGRSILEHDEVSKGLKETLPVTAELGILGILISLVIALPVGTIAAVKQDTAIDYIVRSVSVAMIAVPSFWVAMLIITAGTRFEFWTPQLNYVNIWDDPVGNFKIMWLPAILLGVTLSGSVMRLTRTQMLEVVREDYIRTAKAKGLTQNTIILRHAMRNAAIPIVTLVGLEVPVVIGGSVILETLFSLPGVGRYVISAVRNGDFPIIQAVNLILACAIIFTNLIVDVTYFLIDPRLRSR